MQGHLREIDCSRLLYLIALGQHTGTLCIAEDPENERSSPHPWKSPVGSTPRTWVISFAQGKLIHAWPTDAAWPAVPPTSRLRDCLKRLPLEWPEEPPEESPAVLPAVLPNVLIDPYGPEYSQILQLLEQQKISPHQGHVIARQLSEETLFDIARLRQGRFQFESRDAIAPPFTPFTVPSLVQRLERKLRHWQMLYPLVESVHQCPILRDPNTLAEHLSSAAFGALQRWADGDTSILRLARHLTRHPVDVARAIAPHLRAGTIRLKPARRETPPPQSPCASLSVSLSPGSGQNSGSHRLGHLLWVGDFIAHHPEFHQGLIEPLAQQGFLLRHCQRPFRALEQALQDRPDLIICETALSELSGYEFCRLVRQLTSLNSIPVVIATPQASFWHRHQSQMAGAADDLVEPFRADDLMMLLEKYIGPIPSPATAFPEVSGPDALAVELGHDNGEVKSTFTN